jgi:acyl-CoA thioesterase-1
MPDRAIAGIAPIEVSFMRPFRAELAPPSAPCRKYGKWARAVQAFTAAALLALGWGFAGPDAGRGAAAPASEAERPIRIVALGDSLTAGLGLSADQSFPAKLAQALRRRGANVEVVNAGVSGDTASDGAARLDWSAPDGTDAVIVELGANDALRGLDPKITRDALEDILGRLKQRHIAVLLAGMRAPRNMGASYVEAFDGIFPELASTYGALFYPFFLEGVATDSALNQPDGLHPSAAGVDVIVARILAKTEELIARARAMRGS